MIHVACMNKRISMVKVDKKCKSKKLSILLKKFNEKHTLNSLKR